MSIVDNYKEYRSYKPEYNSWKSQRDLNEQKKIAYLNDNPASKKDVEETTKRAKIILNAVNVMDEYSQSRAEEMEQVTEAIISGCTQPVAYLSVGLAGLTTLLFKDSKKAIIEACEGNFKNLTKIAPAVIAIFLPITIYTIATNIWAAKKEVQASRQGRVEAMNNDLASVKQFAILDENQQKKVDEIASTIKVDKKESNKIINAQNKLGIINSLKSMLKKDDSEKYIANVELNNDNLSENDILEAKKDKELIQNIVEKIDIASQDYAENAELIVGTLSTLGMASGVLSGALVGVLTKMIKPLQKYSAITGTIAGALISIASIIYGTKIQKQASRVGRFKAKNELLNNPEQLVYVDDKKYQDINADVKQKNKQSFISSVKNLIIDNNKYNKYMKENNANNIKQRKAREQIDLTPEQEKRAKQLQNNTFNMFNKLDEKSQTYAESAEAIGNGAVSIIATIAALPCTIATLGMSKKSSKGGLVKNILSIASSMAIPIAANFIITKDQKNASRVANMQAIKELDDYRYFAQKNVKTASEQQTFKQNKKNENEIFAKFLNK